MTHHFAFGYSRDGSHRRTVFSLVKRMVCLTALFSKQSRNFNCPTFQIFNASVWGGGGGRQNLSISYLKPSCLSHEDDCKMVLSKTARFMKREIFRDSRDVKTSYADRYQQSRFSLQCQIFPPLIQVRPL